MKYVTPDGKTFEGATADDVVTAMWKAGLFPEPTIEEYMKGVRARVYDCKGIRIDVFHTQSFIHSIERAGLVKEIGR